MAWITSWTELDNSVKAFFILSAIGVVLFAIWADAYQRLLTAESEVDSENHESIPEPAVQLTQVRTASLLAFITQVLIYFSNTPAREMFPNASICMLVVALISQGQIQFGLEKRIRKLDATSREHFRFALRSALVASLGLGLYIFCVFAFNATALLVCHALKIGEGGMIAAVLIASLLGNLAGVAFNYALSPLFVKKSFPSEPLESERHAELINQCFIRAEIAIPKAYLLRTEHFRFNNAMVTGFPGGKGPFRPHLFLTESLINVFEEKELEAILLHEASHISLRHLRKRLLATLKVVAVTLTGGAIVVGLAHLTLVPPLAAMIDLLVGLFAFFYPAITLRNQMRRQEIEADTHAVVRLKADVDAFSSALRKLDTLNHVSSHSPKAPSALDVQRTHPVTEERIQLMKQAIEFQVALQKAQSEAEHQETKKAA